jgi:hypothetical protein
MQKLTFKSHATRFKCGPRFDLFQHNHPYLAAMINNGTIHYDHDRDGTHSLIGGCEVKFRNFEHETWIAIRYEDDTLTGKRFN